MAAWTLVPCLAALRGEVNSIAPNRDTASDGSIGDAAHRNTNSDHNPDEESAALRDHDADSKNEVHAIDVDNSGPWPEGFSMELAVQHILRRCRSGQERRLKYIIYNERIWSSSSGWVQRTYSGANPHDKHAHFSASYETAHESDTSSWHLEDLMPPITDDEIERIAARVEQRVWNHTEPNPYDSGATSRRMGGDLRMMEYRDDQRALATNVTRLDNQVIPALGRLETAVAAMLGRDFVDEDAVARTLFAHLREKPTEETAQLLVAILGQEGAELVARAVLAEPQG